MANTNKKNFDILSMIGSKGINKNIENLSSIIKLAKKPKSTKSNSFKTDFLTFRVKDTFIHL